VHHPIKIPPEATPHVTTRTSPTLIGKSMPSGHAGMAFLLLIPAFIFTKNRRTTLILATTAITYGTLVGWARITLGAHFLSDVLIALAINLATIKIATHFIKPTTHIKPYWSLGLTALTLAIIIYTQKLHVTLNWQGTLTAAPTFTFPCDITHATTPSQNANLTLEISGKGLPETGLFLTQTNNTFYLKKIGIHYSLKCTGTLSTSQRP